MKEGEYTIYCLIITNREYRNLLEAYPEIELDEWFSKDSCNVKIPDTILELVLDYCDDEGIGAEFIS